MVAEPLAVVVANPQTEPMASASATSSGDASDTQRKSNRIQVSNTKKPLFFYLNLAKRHIKQHNYVELSALGMAIPTAVTISEILKTNGVAVERKVLTSTVGAKDKTKGRFVQKAKLEIVLERNEKYTNQKASSEGGSKANSEAKTERAGTEGKAVPNASDSKSETESGEATASKADNNLTQPN